MTSMQWPVPEQERRGASIDAASARAGDERVTTAKISIVIVSWNAREHLHRCLRSLRDHANDAVVETLVVDNASSDGSPEMVAAHFPQVGLVRCDRNLGFSRANNLGLARTTGDYVALINSDVIVHPGCLQTLVTCLADDRSVGLVGPRIVGPDGRLQLTCRRLPGYWNTWCRLSALDRLFPESPHFSGFELPAARHATRSQVPALGGCFWMLCRAAIDVIGGLDERFFFYAEDMDYCKRLTEGRWRVLYVPEASATHYGGGSSETAPLRYSIEIIRSTLAYWRKHHGLTGQTLCFAMLLMHHGLRLVLRLGKRGAGFGRSAAATHKIVEDVSCLRWLVTRRELPVAREAAG